MEDIIAKKQTNGYALLVGEGNFSFAAAFILKTEYYVVATCLKHADQNLSELQSQNITFIQQNGGKVYTDVDATKMNSHADISQYKYNVILFNFPHIPGKMKIGENRKLLQCFFSSAEKILVPKGKIHVTLCKGQSGTPEDGCSRKWSDTWQIVTLAAHVDLILQDCIPFKCEDYPNYMCSGFRGSEKRFNIEGAMTYIFCRGKPIEKNSFTYEFQRTEKGIALETQLSMCITEDLHHLHEVMANSHHPLNIILTKIAKEMEKASSGRVTELTHCTLFCSLHQQHVALCKQDLLEPVLRNCCRISLLETLLNEAVPELEKHEIFSKTTSCFPCSSFSDFYPYFKPCVMLFSRDYSKIISNIKDTLHCIFSDSKINIHFNDEYNSEIFNSSNFNMLDLNHESVCELVTKMSETGILTSDEYRNTNVDLFAVYEMEVVDGHKSYSGIKFTFEDKVDINSLKVGSLSQLSVNSKKYFYIVLDITHIAMLTYHIFDRRILFDKDSYYTMLLKNDISRNIFRPLALHSPCYVHDLSFWVNKEYTKLKFLLLVKSILKELIFSVNQIDIYYDSETNRQSVCYRFVYSAVSQPLSKEKARDFHTNFREILKKAFCVELR